MTPTEPSAQGLTTASLKPLFLDFSGGNAITTITGENGLSVASDNDTKAAIIAAFTAMVMELDQPTAERVKQLEAELAEAKQKANVAVIARSVAAKANVELARSNVLYRKQLEDLLEASAPFTIPGREIPDTPKAACSYYNVSLSGAALLRLTGVVDDIEATNRSDLAPQETPHREGGPEEAGDEEIVEPVGCDGTHC